MQIKVEYPLRQTRYTPTQAQFQAYQQEHDRATNQFSDYARAYLDGEISLEQFQVLMRNGLKSYYIRVALLAKGTKPLNSRDKRDISRFLAMIYKYLDGFIEDLRHYNLKALASDQGVIHRASSYGYGWGIFSRFTIPGILADMLPELPGLSCLGGEACGCWLEYDSDETGFHVYWYMNPSKEHCIVCTDLDIEWSPYTITWEDISDFYGLNILSDEDEWLGEF